MSEFCFYLGAHHPNWLSTVEAPLFVSHVTLRGRKTLPRRPDGCVWALDSGAFSQIDTYGRWETEPEEYADAVRRYRDEIHGLTWAAPMDWMCEPHMLAKTGLTIRAHQELTVQSVLDLREIAPGLPFAPVIQGWDLQSYVDCIRLYESAGMDLGAEPICGLGSVCRRQGADEIGQIVTTLADDFHLNLHGFGIKKLGVEKYGSALKSSDSMAWSKAGRAIRGCSQGRRGRSGLPIKTEANCLHYALDYRRDLLANVNPWRQTSLPIGA
jgi:hypothetical protein